MLGIKDFVKIALGVSDPVAELISFLLILLMFFLPTFFLKTSNYLISVISILLIATFTAIGWLPFYTWVLLSLYMAITISGKLKGWY